MIHMPHKYAELRWFQVFRGTFDTDLKNLGLWNQIDLDMDTTSMCTCLSRLFPILNCSLSISSALNHDGYLLGIFSELKPALFSVADLLLKISKYWAETRMVTNHPQRLTQATISWFTWPDGCNLHREAYCHSTQESSQCCLVYPLSFSTRKNVDNCQVRSGQNHPMDIGSNCTWLWSKTWKDQLFVAHFAGPRQHLASNVSWSKRFDRVLILKWNRPVLHEQDIN